MRASRPIMSGRIPDISILLWAEVPSLDQDENHSSDLHIRVEEAIISLARAAFAEEGRLVYYGSLSISLLLATVSAEYVQPLTEEDQYYQTEQAGEQRQPPLILFVSIPSANEVKLLDELRLVERAGYAAILWSTGREYSIDRVIRETQPNALVCIGGSENTLDVINSFRKLRSRLPIVIETTGGAAQKVARTRPNDVRIFDRKILQLLSGQKTRQTGQRFFPEVQWKGIPPYPVIMQQIVEELSKSIR